MSRIGWLLRRAARQIWLRAALYSTGSIVLALVAIWLAPFVPDSLAGRIGQDSVGSLLQIIASSMLAVTTFSLTAMVSAYSSATSLATPRATQLLIEDPTSQNALSTFLGAFLFAIVGIIALSTGLYGAAGRTILFIGTVLVVLLIVVTLLRWIAHIIAFGRMADIIDRVEDAARRSIDAFLADPLNGGRAAVPVPAGATRVTSDQTGYIAHVDVRALARIADWLDGPLHVAMAPGKLVHPGRAIVYAEPQLEQETAEAIRACFTIERHRSFDQDPRLGIIALSEIASRALSPATNDPGTAIEVLNAILRVLAPLLAEAPLTNSAPLGNIHVARPTIEEMLTDAFRPIARDGAGELEVGIRLQKTLAALAEQAPGQRDLLARIAKDARARADAAIAHEGDRHALGLVYDGFWR